MCRLALAGHSIFIAWAAGAEHRRGVWREAVE